MAESMLEDLKAALNGDIDNLSDSVAEWFVAVLNEKLDSRATLSTQPVLMKAARICTDGESINQ